MLVGAPFGHRIISLSLSALTEAAARRKTAENTVFSFINYDLS